jgi:hypothetical protein
MGWYKAQCETVWVETTERKTDSFIKVNVVHRAAWRCCVRAKEVAESFLCSVFIKDLGRFEGPGV